VGACLGFLFAAAVFVAGALFAAGAFFAGGAFVSEVVPDLVSVALGLGSACFAAGLAAGFAAAAAAGCYFVC